MLPMNEDSSLGQTSGFQRRGVGTVRRQPPPPEPPSFLPRLGSAQAAAAPHAVVLMGDAFPDVAEILPSPSLSLPSPVSPLYTSQDVPHSAGRLAMRRMRRRRRWYELPDVDEMEWRQIIGLLLFACVATSTVSGLYVVVFGLPDAAHITLDAIVKELFNAHDHSGGGHHGHGHTHSGH